MARRRSIHRRIADTVFASIIKGNNKGESKGKNSFFSIIASLLFVVLACLWTQCVPEDDISNETSVTSSAYGVVPRKDLPGSERVLVERCVDGDTLVVISSVGKERVRLIGANTPETVKPNFPVEPFGPEASEYTKSRIAAADNIAYLVSDGQKLDRYGRRLAVVYLGNDQTSLNELLVRQGLAQANLQYTFSKEFKEKLATAEELARAEGLGIHSLSK